QAERPGQPGQSAAGRRRGGEGRTLTAQRPAEPDQEAHRGDQEHQSPDADRAGEEDLKTSDALLGRAGRKVGRPGDPPLEDQPRLEEAEQAQHQEEDRGQAAQLGVRIGRSHTPRIVSSISQSTTARLPWVRWKTSICRCAEVPSRARVRIRWMASPVPKISAVSETNSTSSSASSGKGRSAIIPKSIILASVP